MMPQREILWNVPPPVMTAVYLFSLVCAAWIVFWFARRARLWNRGEPASQPPRPLAGLKRLAIYLLTHRRIAQDWYTGVMHALVFWGMVGLVIATTLVGIQHHFELPFLTGRTYLVFSLGADLAGVAFSVGIGMALWRRRSAASHGRLLRSASTTWMLWGLLILALTGFLVEGLRIARDFPVFEVWSPAGYLTAKLLAAVGIDGERAVGLHRASWILHAALVMGFFVIIPLTLLRHIILGAYNVARVRGTPGVISPPAAPIVAAIDFAQLRRSDLVEADACLTCGRCTQVCPAEAAGKPLNPRSVVLGLREHLDYPDVPLTAQVADDALWSCTTCSACDTACPVDIRIVDKIITLRRGRVAVGEIPRAAAEALESEAQKFNPFGRANSARMEWASGLSVPVAADGEAVELLYWIGCGGSFDPAGREVARAMVRILDRLKVNYRVLGCRERCTGDPARRLGDEQLWRELAETNHSIIAAHQVKTLLTHCPHCYNTLQNEYPAVGPMPAVVHHSQWLGDRLAEGSLSVRSGMAGRVTFHDPCYLARANGETKAPRAVLDRMAGDNRVEMEAHGKQTFCCGGGGGQLWLDVRGRTRVETIRASHVEATAAHTVATACPFCRVMLEAGRGSLDQGQGNWRVKDIAELIVENLED